MCYIKEYKVYIEFYGKRKILKIFFILIRVLGFKDKLILFCFLGYFSGKIEKYLFKVFGIF